MYGMFDAYDPEPPVARAPARPSPMPPAPWFERVFGFREGEYGATRRAFSLRLVRQLLGVGVFTAACGSAFYLDRR